MTTMTWFGEGGCKMLPLREVRAYVDVMDQVADDLS